MSIPKVIRLMDIQDLILKNNPKANIEKLHKGYVYAAQQHRGQLRQSGEAYLSHPLNVAYILAEMNMDMDSIVAGLLHDTIEDTAATYEFIADMFGRDVAFLVEAVSKISKIPFQSKEEKQAESFRKMLISMSDDVRVIIIKLADRLHNMRTIDSLREDKQKRIARETMDIYAPLAHRLGISWIKWELEDRSFRILNPDEYYEIHQKVKMKRTEREQYLSEVKDIAKTALERANIKCEISGRPKHFYSIYSKMIKKQTTFEDLYDLLALRIIVDEKASCYSALGVIHSLWTPIPHKIKDYIANPKANMYQSIHTTVMGPGAMMVEFQIRTWEMHKIAEEGIAAHWRYKEGKVFDPKEDRRFVWLRKILEDDIRNQAPTDFMNTLKEDVLQKQIYVFTPKGHVVELPEDSTPIDFAYAIHSEIGSRCVGAKVNGRIVPLKAHLHSGDKVEILTSQTQEPRKDWLNIAKTSRARSRISAYLRKKDMERAVFTGRELLSKEFKASGLDYEKILEDDKNLKKALEKFTLRSSDELIANVGFGQISPRKVLHLFNDSGDERGEQEIYKRPQGAKAEPFKINGIDNMMMKTARCCSPLPGDEVKGYISTGRGIVVHKADCPNLIRLARNDERIVDVAWDDTKAYTAPVKYNTYVEDKPGMFIAISTIIKDMGLNIYEMNVKSNGAGMTQMDFIVKVSGKAQADQLTARIRSEKGVISVRQG